MNRSDLQEALTHENARAFLRVIREGESSQDEDAYSVMFGGDHFESFADHPRQRHVANGYTSTAAGAYQFLVRTWDSLVKQYGFPDFSPQSQDEGAIALIAGRGALQDVLAGRIGAAIRKCSQEWASLPGSQYGQPTQKLQKALQVFTSYGGTLAEAAQALSVTPIAKEVRPMGVFLSLLPSLLQMIPSLIPVFSSSTDSEVAKRNQAAAVVVADGLIKATGAVNIEEAHQKMQDDPAILAAAQAAMNELVPTLLEVGTGGVAEARKQAASIDQLPPWKNAAVWITAAFVPLIYGAGYAVLYREGASDDLKTMVVTAIFAGLLGSITGFFLGSSLGSQKKDAALGGSK